jgi:hypothetical protein
VLDLVLEIRQLETADVQAADVSSRHLLVQHSRGRFGVPMCGEDVGSGHRTLGQAWDDFRRPKSKVHHDYRRQLRSVSIRDRGKDYHEQ